MFIELKNWQRNISKETSLLFKKKSNKHNKQNADFAIFLL